MNRSLKSNKTKAAFSKETPFIYGDLSSYCDEFRVAIDLLTIQSTEKALHFFQLAYESVNQSDIYHNKYASYCGFVRLLCNDIGGLELCREAARNEKRDADVFLNLARAEWHFRNRKKTIAALENGLQIDRRHPGILDMMQQLGVRKRKVLPLLDRNHKLNNFMGKLLRKNTR